jgi:hypothetical protein
MTVMGITDRGDVRGEQSELVVGATVRLAELPKLLRLLL